MPVINFYSAHWCPDCAAARRFLEERQIEYNLIDVDNHPEAVEVIIAARGKRVLPTLEYRGRFIDANRFDRQRFEADLTELLRADS